MVLVQGGSAFADSLEVHFKTTKLLRAQFGEHSPHLPGMLSKGGNNQVLAAWGEGDDSNAAVFGALDPAHQALRDQAIDRDTDRAWGQINNRAYRVNGQRPSVQQEFQHREVREAESGLLNISGCVPCQGAHRLHHYQPDLVRPLKTSGHKNLNLPESYIINYLDIDMINANVTTPIEKENRL